MCHTELEKMVYQYRDIWMVIIIKLFTTETPYMVISGTTNQLKYPCSPSSVKEWPKMVIQLDYISSLFQHVILSSRYEST